MRFTRVLIVLLAAAIVLAAGVWWFVAEDLRRVRGIIRAAGAAETPELALAALVAAEDPDHFRHSRFYTMRTMGGVVADDVDGHASLANGLVRQTIQGRGLRRQSREVLVTAILEATETPSAILRAYAANVYLGSNDDGLIFGIDRGARIYFGKPAGSLSAAECAALAAAVRSPHMYPVLGNSQRAVERRRLVLQRMDDARRSTTPPRDVPAN